MENSNNPEELLPSFEGRDGGDAMEDNQFEDDGYDVDGFEDDEYNVDVNAMIAVDNIEDDADVTDQNNVNTGDSITEENSSDEEEHQFDISLAASHSYMGMGLVGLRGRSVLEAGWEARVPCVAHHGAVFPGETVPMLLPHRHDAGLLARAIHHDRIFGLLCPDESGTMVSGYGVLCEVFEAGTSGGGVVGAAGGGVRGGRGEGALSFKARAIHRFRFVQMPKQPIPIHVYARVRQVEVRVLPELRREDPLRAPRLASLDPLRRANPLVDRRVRSMDAAVSPWPRFVYDMFDYRRMRAHIADYFRTIMLERLPEDLVSLSFWVASNLALSARDRLALFVVDDALLRLHMEMRFISRKSVLCCAACLAEIARRDHVVPMSSEGVHSNYTNLGGYMHDIVTVSRAQNTALSGAPSAEFSWFPGYTWTIALCAACMAHVGWRFDAMKKNLRPQQFYGLCRNYVQPRGEDERAQGGGAGGEGGPP